MNPRTSIDATPPPGSPPIGVVVVAADGTLYPLDETRVDLGPRDGAVMYRYYGPPDLRWGPGGPLPQLTVVALPAHTGIDLPVGVGGDGRWRFMQPDEMDNP